MSDMTRKVDLWRKLERLMNETRNDTIQFLMDSFKDTVKQAMRPHVSDERVLTDLVERVHRSIAVNAGASCRVCHRPIVNPVRPFFLCVSCHSVLFDAEKVIQLIDSFET